MSLQLDRQKQKQAAAAAAGGGTHPSHAPGGAPKSAKKRNQLLAVVGVVVLVAVAAWLAIAQLRSGGGAVKGTGEAKDWYTIDDGRTWFADSADKIPPFEHNGKTAYRCRVWSCDGGKTKFVSHLERVTEAARKKMESGKARTYRIDDDLEMGSIEVKPPGTGDRGWVNVDSPSAMKIQTPRCPSGANDKLQMIRPE